MASKASSKGKGGSGSISVVLPADARLAGLDEVVPQLREAAKAAAAELDARRGGSCGRRRCCSCWWRFAARPAASGCAVSWLGASEALREAAGLLGLRQRT